jgi:DNA repair protein RecO (recombination protein O)
VTNLVTTDAIVLKSLNYSESSVILTFYSQEHGKLTGMVKGARRTKTAYGSALHPMSHVRIVLYEKSGRDIQTVTACDSVRQFKNLSEDLDKMVVGFAIVELVRNIAHEQEPNPRLFATLTGTLAALNDSAGNYVSMFHWFELRLASILGFTPEFQTCAGCGKPLANEADELPEFHLEKGRSLAGACKETEGKKLAVSMNILSALQTLSEIDDPAEVPALNLPRPISREIDNLLWAFLSYHVSGIRPLKTRKVYQSMMESL